MWRVSLLSLDIVGELNFCSRLIGTPQSLAVTRFGLLEFVFVPFAVRLELSRRAIGYFFGHHELCYQGKFQRLVLFISNFSCETCRYVLPRAVVMECSEISAYETVRVVSPPSPHFFFSIERRE